MTETLYESILPPARLHPEKVVLVDERRLLDYQRLLRDADGLAARLLSVASAGDRVGVLLEYSVHTAVAYFACLRAGVVYVPLRPHPNRILANLVDGLGLAVLVTDRPVQARVPQISPDAAGAADRDFPATDPAAPAHLLLTSGTSTGRPKAVLTDQRGSLISHRWRTSLWPFQADDVVGCNVFGIWDVVPALQHGIPAVMIPDSALSDPLALAGVVVRHGITRMMLTPTLLGACLASSDAVAALRRLRMVVLCGEIARPGMLRLARRMLPATRLLNLYSTSECHDVAAAFVDEDDAPLRPAPFADVRLVDAADRRRQVGSGETGRVIVGGPAVALGYLDGEPGGFFDEAGLRFFDTGDLGVAGGGGTVTLVGRADARAKVRGRWVDPSEVEAVIASHPGVVAVAVRIDHGRVGARVVGRGADLAPRLHAYMARRLPAHAIPTRLELVERLAVSPSGKAGGSGADPAGTDLEGQVVRAYREVLGNDGLGPEDDFVDIGGHSIEAIELCGHLQRLSGYPLHVDQLYREGRPAAVARLLESGSAELDQAWRLPVERPPVDTCRAAVLQGIPLLTGASGYLGQAVAARLGQARIDLRRPAMSLDEPNLGLSAAEFEALAGKLGGIVHTAAHTDPFAGFDAHYRTNVEGTLALIRLAGMRRVPIRHVSSSAVLPLGSRQTWTPDTRPSEALADELRASGADAYSYTKLGAELALWRAADEGLPVRIVRVPHLLGHPRNDRLMQTLLALQAAGVYPAGGWQWQFAASEAVVEALIATPTTGAEIRHVALPPVAVEDLIEHLGLSLTPVPMAAIPTALARVDPAHPHAVHVKVLHQLVVQHGPVAALCMNDAILSSDGGEPLSLFAGMFERS